MENRGAGVSIMTVSTMQYLRLKFEKASLITLKMENKKVCQLMGMIQNVIISVFIVVTCVDFHVDFVIYKSRIDHLKKLEKVFQRLDETRIILSLKKTMIVVTLGRMVEHIITKDDIAIDPKKIKVIKRVSFPKTKQVVKVFLGAIGYYQCYVLRYTMISKPFARFLKKDAPPPQETLEVAEFF